MCSATTSQNPGRLAPEAEAVTPTLCSKVCLEGAGAFVRACSIESIGSRKALVVGMVPSSNLRYRARRRGSRRTALESRLVPSLRLRISPLVGVQSFIAKVISSS